MNEHSILGQAGPDVSMRRAKKSEQHSLDGIAEQAVQNRKHTLFKSSSTCTISETMRGQFPFPDIAATKSAHNLQLPSFDLLGIAAPHPDRSKHHPEHVHSEDELVTTKTRSSSVNTKMSHTRCENGNCKALSLLDALKIGVEPRGHLPSGYVFTLTPPAEEGPSLSWQTATHPFLKDPIQTLAINQKEPSVNEASTPANGATLSDAADSNNPPSTRDAPQSIETSSNTTNPASHSGNQGGEGIAQSSWLDQSIRTLVSKVATSSSTGYAVRVLSHALPCPSSCEADGIKNLGSLSYSSNQPSSDMPVSPSSAFPSIIDAIHDRLHPGQAPCIHVTHAVPSRFNLANLPSSPPGTPNPTSGGEDYFNTMVFSSAVPLLDNQDRANRQSSTPVPSSPCPIVPPSSIHISVVERYIPPKSAQEYLDLFSPNSPSLLVDRLVELSPNSGRLLFIYPTKIGGRKFTTDFLGPILDPILRAMVVVNEFSADLGNTLGRMEAVDQMLGFHQMKHSIINLCKDLSRSTKYSLLYSGTEEVLLERKVWSEWWVQQESGRIREGLGRYFRKARRLPADSDVAPINLIREIIDGVSSRQYDTSSAPSKGFEVGVFVIQRSS
ncbi:MAG: hypothetical protein M1835_002335 [Candelina submexicana]|nr:MAG: hypothetical protein M1835_002335 [Candelina submexicana]